MEKKPLRVLQIMGIVEYGGVESVVMNYYRHINKNLIQFDFVMHKGSNIQYICNVNNMGGKVFEITPYTKNIIKFIYDIYKIVKNNHYNIVHCNMNSLSVFPLFAAWLGGAKVRIIHNHTVDSMSEPLRTIIKRALRPLAKLFANNYWSCSRLSGIWMYGKSMFDSGDITIINNAIDIDKFTFSKDKRDKLRKELGIEGNFVIGHVGRFVNSKNHSFLIDIFCKIIKKKKNSMLILIGNGPLIEDIKKKVYELGVTDKVLFLGNRSDVYDLYNMMDILALPSFYEGFALVAIEAQANGLPVICSEYITDEININDYVEFLPLNIGAEKWASAIEFYSKANCRKYNKNLRHTRFDICTETVRLENLYKQLYEKYIIN